MTAFSTAAMLDAHLGSRARERRATVVECALAAQPRDGVVDLVRVVAAARQPLAHLRLRQLAPGEQLEGRNVRLRCQIA